jgi:hypothetical protein
MTEKRNMMRSSVNRSGYAAIEVLVGATLTLALIGLFATLTFRIRSVDRSSIQYQAATQELANRLEPFRAMDRGRAIEIIEDLDADEALKDRLPGATLKGTVVDDKEGLRVLLELNWDRTVPAQPIRMVAWIKELPK